MTLFLGLLALNSQALTTPLNYFSVNEPDVEQAACKTKLPISDRYIKNWIKQQTRRSPLVSRIQIGSYHFANESYFLTKIFEATQGPRLSFFRPVLSESKTGSRKCDKVVCALSELYGDEQALRIIYLFGEFGYNASFKGQEDERPFTADELAILTRSFSDLPISLRKLKKEIPISMIERSGPYGNAVIQLLTGWTFLETWQKNSTVYHEISHNLAEHWNNLDRSVPWIHLSGWTKSTIPDNDVFNPLAWQRGSQLCISEYACKNAVEYFAESFTGFRYAPLHLQKTNPEIFAFIQKYYGGISYLKNLTCEKAHPEFLYQSADYERLRSQLVNRLQSLVAANPNLNEDLQKNCFEQVNQGRSFSFKDAKKIQIKTKECVDQRILKISEVTSTEYSTAQLIIGLQPETQLKILSQP